MTELSTLLSRKWPGMLILLLALAMCEVALLNIPGTGDTSTFLLWMGTARQYGIYRTYSIAADVGVHNGRDINLWRQDGPKRHDASYKSVQPVLGAVEAGYYHSMRTSYAPLGIMILGLFSKVADFLDISDLRAFKISLGLFLLGSASVMAFWQGKWQPALGVAAFLALLFNSMCLAYTDIYAIFFLFLSFYFLERQYFSTGGALFVISFFVKWQPIILAPLIVIYLLSRGTRTENLLKLSRLSTLASSLAAVLVAFLLFGSSLVTAFIRGTRDDVVSGHGLNFNWLYTAFYEVTHGTLQQGLVQTIFPFTSHPFVYYVSRPLGILMYMASLIWYFFSDRSLISMVRAGLVCFLAYFTFWSGVHENHLIVAVALGICWAAMDRARILEAILLTLFCDLNMYIFGGAEGNGISFSTIVGWDVTVYLALFNVLFALFLLGEMLFSGRIRVKQTT